MDNRPRILAVDDHEDMLEIIRMALEDHYDVITLSNPMDLYEILDVFEPDLLILDIMMPRITGYQLLEILKKNQGTRELPVIILSAKSTPADLKHGYKLGAAMYLTKPFTPDRLLKNVETQFKVSPPNPKKTNDLSSVAMQVELKPSFKKGHVQFSSRIMRKEQVFNLRKKLEEKIKKEEAENRRSWQS